MYIYYGNGNSILKNKHLQKLRGLYFVTSGMLPIHGLMLMFAPETTISEKRFPSIPTCVWCVPSWEQRCEGSTVWQYPQNAKYSFELRSFLKISIVAASPKKIQNAVLDLLCVILQANKVEISSLRYSLSRSFAVELPFWDLIFKNSLMLALKRHCHRFTGTSCTNLAKFQLG